MHGDSEERERRHTKKRLSCADCRGRGFSLVLRHVRERSSPPAFDPAQAAADATAASAEAKEEPNETKSKESERALTEREGK